MVRFYKRYALNLAGAPLYNLGTYAAALVSVSQNRNIYLCRNRIRRRRKSVPLRHSGSSGIAYFGSDPLLISSDKSQYARRNKKLERLDKIRNGENTPIRQKGAILYSASRHSPFFSVILSISAPIVSTPARPGRFEQMCTHFVPKRGCLFKLRVR